MLILRLKSKLLRMESFEIRLRLLFSRFRISRSVKDYKRVNTTRHREGRGLTALLINISGRLLNSLPLELRLSSTYTFRFRLSHTFDSTLPASTRL